MPAGSATETFTTKVSGIPKTGHITHNDTLFAEGDAKADSINCGDDASGDDVDTAHVNGQDTVDSQDASLITTTTGLSCEMLFVDGVAIPQA